jgi:hypothetical protein
VMGPENRVETGRDRKGRFVPGVSGNAGGRPRSIAETLVKCRPSVSKELCEFWLLIAFGSAADVQRRFGVKPRLQDRMAAASELANRLHGKPVSVLEHESEADGHVPAFILPPGTQMAIT